MSENKKEHCPDCIPEAPYDFEGSTGALCVKHNGGKCMHEMGFPTQHNPGCPDIIKAKNPRAELDRARARVAELEADVADLTIVHAQLAKTELQSVRLEGQLAATHHALYRLWEVLQASSYSPRSGRLTKALTQAETALNETWKATQGWVSPDEFEMFTVPIGSHILTPEGEWLRADQSQHICKSEGPPPGWISLEDQRRREEALIKAAQEYTGDVAAMGEHDDNIRRAMLAAVKKP